MSRTADPNGGGKPLGFLFHNLRFYFISELRHHSRMKHQIAKEFGGTIQESVELSTTHIVCPKSVTMAKLAAAVPSVFPLSRFHLVTQDFVVSSIIKGALADPAAFRPKVEEAAAPAAAAAVSPPSKRPKTQTPNSVPPDVRTPPFAAAKHPNSRVSRLPAAAAESPPPVLRNGGATSQEEREESDAERGADAEPCQVERRGSEWVAVRGRKPTFTGGHTGIPWGSFGVFAEPFDEDEARDTVNRLANHWFKTGVAGADSPGKQGPAKVSNEVCQHAACAARSFCLAKGLEEVKEGIYTPGRDQFKIKAIERAVRTLVNYPHALDTDEDVDAVPRLGKKSAEKVKELLRQGYSSRLAAVSEREDVAAKTVFQGVWGAGATVVDEWWQKGNRSLEDVRRKAASGELQLSTQQDVGVRYAEDFAQRIPREEVAQAEAIAREAIFEVVERLGATDPERTYAFAAGSYSRGSPTSSDIDILVVLPPSLAHQHCGEFLHRLRSDLLRRRGLLADEMGASEEFTPDRLGGPNHDSKASWMGLCRLPGKSVHRRFDLKVYRWQHAACALNYFANSMAFCRATRHWANTSKAAKEAVKKRGYPAATGYKISDQEMVPRAKRFRSGDRHDSGPMGPPLPLENETELFEEVGLSYVPVTMRYFNNYK